MKIYKNFTNEFMRILSYNKLENQIIFDLINVVRNVEEKNLSLELKNFIKDWEATIELDKIGISKHIKKCYKNKQIKYKKIPLEMSLIDYIDYIRKKK